MYVNKLVEMVKAWVIMQMVLNLNFCEYKKMLREIYLFLRVLVSHAD